MAHRLDCKMIQQHAIKRSKRATRHIRWHTRLLVNPAHPQQQATKSCSTGEMHIIDMQHAFCSSAPTSSTISMAFWRRHPKPLLPCRPRHATTRHSNYCYKLQSTTVQRSIVDRTSWWHSSIMVTHSSQCYCARRVPKSSSSSLSNTHACSCSNSKISFRY
jgi:hypothetical protein